MIDDSSVDTVDRAGIPLGESGGSQMLIDNQVVTLRFVSFKTDIHHGALSNIFNFSHMKKLI